MMEVDDLLWCSEGFWEVFFQWVGPSVPWRWEGSGVKVQGGMAEAPPPYMGGTMRPAMAETHTGNRKWVRAVSDWSLITTVR